MMHGPQLVERSSPKRHPNSPKTHKMKAGVSTRPWKPTKVGRLRYALCCPTGDLTRRFPFVLAAKQAEFEEASRLKNQFKALDEDDVDFLDSVLDTERAKEQAVKRETAEQLDAYRKQQAAAQKPDLSAMQADTPTSNDADAWVTKKRRRKELDNPISKFRKTSTTTAPAPEVTTPTQKAETKRSDSASSSPPSTVTKPATFSGSSLGLGAYSSDED